MKFEHLLSRVQFTFKNNLSEGNITITDVQITEAAKTAELNCVDADMANWAWNATATGAYNFGNTGTIAQGASGATENVQFLFPAATQNYNISFNFTYESDVAEARTATIADVNLVMGKAYNINVTIEDKDIVTEQYKIEFFVAEVKDWGDNIELNATLNEAGHGFENGHEYVDLGLSVKWATCNVGATTPEEYGDFFAWGETEPKEEYSWSTYKYCVDNYDNFTKYCSLSSYGNNGFIDSKTVLDPEDDAATANWGGAWRMPTDEEWSELITECTWTYTTPRNGVYGYKLTGPNGNSIFLLAAGYVNGSYHCADDASGLYFSSSLYTDDPIRAYIVNLAPGGVGVDSCYRYGGLPVRPVCQ